MPSSPQIALVIITFVAAIVNGALGYGFSSITVPIALLFLANRVLNPALVPIEVVLNAYMLWANREALTNVWRRVLPIVIGLVPGVALGTAIVSQVNPGWLRFATFVTLLPLILLQAAGYRPPEPRGTIGRPRVWRRRRRALFGDDDLRPAAGRHAQQPGVDEEGFSRGAGLRPSRRIVAHGGRVLRRRVVQRRQLRARPVDCAEHLRRRSPRRDDHPESAARDVQARLHELRRLGRRVRPLQAAG